jgi:hypothetical protein
MNVTVRRQKQLMATGVIAIGSADAADTGTGWLTVANNPAGGEGQ